MRRPIFHIGSRALRLRAPSLELVLVTSLALRIINVVVIIILIVLHQVWFVTREDDVISYDHLPPALTCKRTGII